MTRKKQVPLKIGRLGGAMITFGFIGVIVLIITFGIYNNLEADKITTERNEWRTQSCEDMKKDFDINPSEWKWISLNDKCYTDPIKTNDEQK